MAALNYIAILLTCSLGFVCATAGFFDRVFDGVDSCHDACDKTYAAHTYENGEEADSCKRGCRFHSIMALIHDHDENETMTDCLSSCHEAYNSTSHNGSSEVDACMVGCQSQPPTPQAVSTDDDAEAMAHMLYPLLYMHHVYSSMLDHVYQRMEYSWSIFRQGDQVVVVRSQPVFISFMPAQDGEMKDVPEDTPWPDDRTSSLVETNIAGQDNSATPLFSFAFGPSQLRSSHSMAAPHDIQMDVQVDSSRADWLSCVARKTGIARIVLSLLILATAVVMIWFCVSAAATAPEQHLSINGDLEYLRGRADKDSYLKLLAPQSRVQARPLPVKIRVQQI